MDWLAAAPPLLPRPSPGVGPRSIASSGAGGLSRQITASAKVRSRSFLADEVTGGATTSKPGCWSQAICKTSVSCGSAVVPSSTKIRVWPGRNTAMAAVSKGHSMPGVLQAGVWAFLNACSEASPTSGMLGSSVTGKPSRRASTAPMGTPPRSTAISTPSVPRRCQSRSARLKATMNRLGKVLVMAWL